MEATSLDSDQRCLFDYLQIEERNDKEVLQSQKYCSDMPKEFTSSSEIVVFK